MALKKTVLTTHGFDAVDAYHRVEGVRLNGKTSLFFQVRSYKDDSGVPAFADASYDAAYSINGANPIAQAYEHLKTLPAFAGAIDC
tara:strand:- start:113 stop:370 length:258 start_codon:yes stop_codon:yes gene_type:complete